VNLAARIESACEPRHVFVYETVAEGLSRASTGVAGEYALKDVDGKQKLYRAV
jgi:class 3 adenylate cyclase